MERHNYIPDKDKQIVQGRLELQTEEDEIFDAAKWFCDPQNWESLTEEQKQQVVEVVGKDNFSELTKVIQQKVISRGKHIRRFSSDNTFQ